MGKGSQQAKGKSVGNSNDFKITKWYSLGTKIKDKELQRAK